MNICYNFYILKKIINKIITLNYFLFSKKLKLIKKTQILQIIKVCKIMFSKDCFFLLVQATTTIKKENLSRTIVVRNFIYYEKSWHENGQKDYECNWKNGKKDGLEQEWHENGQKWIERTWKTGKKNGLERCWYENGQKSVKRTWKNGKRKGLERHWHENGQKEYECNWKNGLKEGLEQRWHKNGQKIYKANWKNGKIV